MLVIPWKIRMYRLFYLLMPFSVLYLWKAVKCPAFGIFGMTDLPEISCAFSFGDVKEYFARAGLFSRVWPSRMKRVVK